MVNQTAEPSSEPDSPGGEAFLISFDLGPGASAGQLAYAQSLIDDVITAATLFASLEEIYDPRAFLRRNRERLYLRTDYSRQNLRPQPRIVASGYSNPIYDIFQDPATTAAAVAAASAAGLGVITLVGRVVEVVKKIRLNNLDIRASKAELLQRIAEADTTAERTLAEASKVDTTAGRVEDPHSGIEGPYRPGISSDTQQLDALRALAADGLLRAALNLANAPDDPEALKLLVLDVEEAARRIPIIQATQRDLLELASGAIEPQEFEERFIDRRDQAHADDPQQAPPERPDSSNVLRRSQTGERSALETPGTPESSESPGGEDGPEGVN